MIDIRRFALNRIVYPSAGLDEFFDIARDAGMDQVELRNDIRDGKVIDDIDPQAALNLAHRRGMRVITINALQKFNLASVRESKVEELRDLLRLARSIECGAVVMCPNNDASDLRDPEGRFSETVDALEAFGPLFTKNGVIGLVEPLGFSISSLASVKVAQDAIRKSGHSCYRIVFDTFHHDIGPDTEALIRAELDVSLIGLLHVSGVEASIPKETYLDAHRVLPGPADRMKSRDQIKLLLELGYTGPISFEPFAESVQKMGRTQVVDELKKSLRYLAA
ncbi:MAG TPA: TIM barrel protein [Spirochaetia bacterium]|nr:TIM barrel protein [Spirochaetia bacterium]